MLWRVELDPVYVASLRDWERSTVSLPPGGEFHRSIHPSFMRWSALESACVPLFGVLELACDCRNWRLLADDGSPRNIAVVRKNNFQTLEPMFANSSQTISEAELAA